MKIIDRIKSHKILIGVVFICLLLLLFYLDDLQQKQFGKISTAYYLMSQDKYEEAAKLLEEYISIDSEAYWTEIEIFNGKDADCTRSHAIETLKRCQDKIKEH